MATFSTASLLPHHPPAAPLPTAITTDLAKTIVSNVASPGLFPRGPLPADLDAQVEARNGAVARTLTPSMARTQGPCSLGYGGNYADRHGSRALLY